MAHIQRAGEGKGEGQRFQGVCLACLLLEFQRLQLSLVQCQCCAFLLLLLLLLLLGPEPEPEPGPCHLTWSPATPRIVFFNLSAHVVCQRRAVCGLSYLPHLSAPASPAAHLQICKLKMFCHADRKNSARRRDATKF